MKGIVIVLSLFSLSLIACDEAGFMFPKNNLSIPVSEKNSGITQDEFNQIITEFEGIYTPIFKKRNVNFKINRNWKSTMVNARAHRRGRTRFVTMYGGMARHPEMTKLGFALVVCHEIGHHLGGSPMADPFMSSEGQSDYFASTKCMRRYFRSKTLRVKSKSALVLEKCSETYASQSEIDECVLTADGGMSLARIFATLENREMPKFETPDTSTASRTNYRHSNSQCRLDTYFQGALCDRDIDSGFSPRDEEQGACYKANGDDQGYRPTCWFRAKR